MEKIDMSNTCCQEYATLWYMTFVTNELEEDKFKEWYMSHCKKCTYMKETCMHELG